MTNVSSLNIELTAKSDQFNRKVDSARRSVKKWGDQARRAKKETQGVSESFTRAANAVAILDGPLGPVAGRLSSVASGFKAVGVAGTAAGVAVAAAGALFLSGLKAFAESERQLYRAEGLLKATGYASGFTADQLDRQARSVAMNTLASTEGIRDAQGVLLTFRSVSGETFKRAINLSQDMASVMGSDAKSAALQLGKALEDPAKGLSALTRSGVSFTQAEKDKIKSLQESGKLLEAQGVLLNKVAGQFGGAAKNEAKGLAGAVDTLSQSWTELLETMADESGAAEMAQNTLLRMADGAQKAKEYILPDKTEDLFMRRIELLGELAEAEKGLEQFRGRSFESLPDMPIPYVLDKGDWRNVQYEVSRINKEIQKIDDQMQGQIDSNEKRISQEKEAYNKMLEQQGAMKKQAAEAKRIADEEKRRVDLQKEAVQLAKSRTSKSDSLYQKLFADDEKKPKNYNRNFAFEFDAKAAKRAINSGSQRTAAHYIDQAEAGYRAAKNYGWANNYDLEGMKDVIIALREQAGLDYKDPNRERLNAAIERQAEAQNSILEIERQNGEQIKLVADNSKAMAEKVGQFLDVQNKTLQEAAKQNAPTKKFVLELAVPGKGKKISILGESQDDVDAALADVLEGAAAGI